jgi:hypothetical protein
MIISGMIIPEMIIPDILGTGIAWWGAGGDRHGFAFPKIGPHPPRHGNPSEESAAVGQAV